MNCSVNTSTVMFDFDGVLFDTKPAVLKAYEAAGVPVELAEANWGKPWQDWLSHDPEAHELKTKFYRQTVQRFVYPLQPHYVYRALRALGLVTGIMTSASRQAMQTFADLDYIDAVDVITVSASRSWKHEILKALSTNKYYGAYVDDNLESGLEIIKDTEFKLWHFNPSNRHQVNVYETGESKCCKSLYWQEAVDNAFPQSGFQLT